MTASAIADAAASSGIGGGISEPRPSVTWSTDPWTELTSARVVVSWAGQNSIADLAAAAPRAVVIPQQRPFAEQRETAECRSIAPDSRSWTTEWPPAAEWGRILDRATNVAPGLGALAGSRALPREPPSAIEP